MGDCVELCSSGVVEARENLYKVPETWDVRGSQDSKQITLAEMPNSGKMELEKITSSR